MRLLVGGLALLVMTALGFDTADLIRRAYATSAALGTLVSAVLDVADACDAAVARRVPAASVEELDLTPVLRARETVPGDGAEARRAAAAVRDVVLSRVEQLR